MPHAWLALSLSSNMSTKTIIKRGTQTIDATDQVLGRLASQIAIFLRGKHRPTWQPHIDAGDIVEIVNVNGIRVTGNKLVGKIYYRHSGHPGGLKALKLKERLAKGGYGDVLRDAVYTMLPETRFRDAMMNRLIIKK